MKEFKEKCKKSIDVFFKVEPECSEWIYDTINDLSTYINLLEKDNRELQDEIERLKNGK